MIDVPELADTRWAMLDACGHFSAKSRKLIQLIKTHLPADKPWIAEDAKGLLMVLRGGGKGPAGKRHLHISIVKPKFRDELPNHKTNCSMKDAMEKLAAFEDAPIDVVYDAEFRIPFQKVPKDQGLIRFTEVVHDKLTIKQTRARFSFSAGPIDQVEWMLRRDGQEVLVDLQKRTLANINSNYLKGFEQVATSAFKLLVLGEKSDVQSNG